MGRGARDSTTAAASVNDVIRDQVIHRGAGEGWQHTPGPCRAQLYAMVDEFVNNPDLNPSCETQIINLAHRTARYLVISTHRGRPGKWTLEIAGAEDRETAVFYLNPSLIMEGFKGRYVIDLEAPAQSSVLTPTPSGFTFVIDWDGAVSPFTREMLTDLQPAS